MTTVGRPRSSAVSKAIMDAVLELIAEHGSISAVSVEAVAARSGASKATIYRRWSSREELVAAAVDCLKSPPDLELPHESLRDDLLRIGRSVRTDFSDAELVVLRSMSLEANRNPELAKQHDLRMARRRKNLQSVFAYWEKQGVLRDDVDPRLAAAMFISPILMVMVYGHQPELKRRRDLVEQLLDSLLQGIEK